MAESKADFTLRNLRGTWSEELKLWLLIKNGKVVASAKEKKVLIHNSKNH